MIILGYIWSKWISQKSILEADERECVTKTGLDIGHMQQDKFDWAAVLERNVPLTASTWNSSMEFQSPGKKKTLIRIGRQVSCISAAWRRIKRKITPVGGNSGAPKESSD